MNIPKLNFEKSRDREYNSYTPSEHAKVLREWLFNGTLGHREIDREILLIDKDSRGFISMGILHHLGLKKDFKGIFRDSSLKEAINYLKKDNQDFALIIKLLDLTEEDDDFSQDEKFWRKKDLDFEDRFLFRLREMDETDGFQELGRKIRKEQANLRALLFKKEDEAQCALCHKILPTAMLWVSHIKPRSDCSTSERTDRNVVMPACKLGCDDLFEKRYLLVDNNGKIYKNNEKLINKSLQTFMEQYDGKECKAFNQLTSEYFKFRRDIESKTSKNKKNKFTVSNLVSSFKGLFETNNPVKEEEAQPHKIMSNAPGPIADEEVVEEADQPVEIDGVSMKELENDVMTGKLSKNEALSAIEIKLTRRNMPKWSRKRWTHMRNNLAGSVLKESNFKVRSFNNKWKPNVPKKKLAATYANLLKNSKPQEEEALTENVAKDNDVNKLKPKVNLLKEAYAKTKRRRR